MKIAFLLVRRVPDLPSPLLVQVAERLRRRGHHVTGFVVEDELMPADPPAEETLYLLKSHTELALSVASALDARGHRVFNPLPACATAQNKVLANQRLAAAGLPVPPTWTTGSPWAARPLLEDGPLVVKPLRGHRGEGVHVVSTPAELAGLPASGACLVQRHVPGPGHDLKVYVVGDRVWAVRKQFDRTSFARPGTPVAVSEEILALAHRVGAVSGLELFGFDVIESDEGPVIVDLNYFPGYKGCEGVADPMAQLLHEVATEERPPPPMPELAAVCPTAGDGPAARTDGVAERASARATVGAR